MQPNAAFNEPKTITVGSKMNDDSGAAKGGDVPF
jgi:hypothetical protein